MKIISKNNVVTCKWCNTVYEYEPSDVKTYEKDFDTYTTSIRRVSYVICPICRNQHIIANAYV